MKREKETKVEHREGREERNLKNETHCHNCMSGYQYASSKSLQLNLKNSAHYKTLKLVVSILKLEV